MAVIEPELLKGRRAFPTAQALFAGQTLFDTRETMTVGWHDTGLHAEQGSFALIQDKAGLDELIGEIVKVSTERGRAVFVYVLGGAGVPTELSLTRRCFAALGLLALESMTCTVEVVE